MFKIIDNNEINFTGMISNKTKVQTELLKRIILLQGDMKQGEFAKKIGLAAPNYSKIINGQRQVGDSTINKIILNLGVSGEWLRYGKGTMYLAERCSSAGVPLYNGEIYNLNSFDFIDVGIEPAFKVDYQPFNDCDLYLTVLGDSMPPDLKNGDVIALKKLSNFDFLPFGSLYFLLTTEAYNNLKLFRRIYQHIDVDKLVLRMCEKESNNELVIPKDGIASIYIIKGVIKQLSY